MSQSARSSVAPCVAVVDGRAITTSLDVARTFGKRHSHVVRAIESLLEQLPSDHAPKNGHMVRPALTTVAIGSGATRDQAVYELTRDGFTLLAMGFTGKRALQFKLDYIAAFNRMEAELNGRAESVTYDTIPAKLRAAKSALGTWSYHAAETIREAGLEVPTFPVELLSDEGLATAVVGQLLTRGRWMLSFDHTMQVQLTPVHKDAYVITLAELTKAIASGDTMTPSEDLIALADAANKQIARRLVWREKEAAS